MSALGPAGFFAFIVRFFPVPHAQVEPLADKALRLLPNPYVKCRIIVRESET